MNAETAARVMEALSQLYPEVRPELNFSNPFETLIATILSAQCTDKRVNLVTARLFPQYPDAFALAQLTPEALEPMIRECGLYHNKAKNIVAACRALVERYDGQVPNTREELMKLPVYTEDSPFVEVLCGHLHFSWDGQLTEKVHQHVFSAAFDRYMGLITISGN